MTNNTICDFRTTSQTVYVCHKFISRGRPLHSAAAEC